MMEKALSLKSAVATILGLVGAYLVARWFWHFNGLSRMLFGVTGVAFLGISILLAPFKKYDIPARLIRPIGWLLAIAGSTAAALLLYAVIHGE
jgi:hypothetical protein